MFLALSLFSRIVDFPPSSMVTGLKLELEAKLLLSLWCCRSWEDWSRSLSSFIILFFTLFFDSTFRRGLRKAFDLSFC